MSERLVSVERSAIDINSIAMQTRIFYAPLRERVEDQGGPYYLAAEIGQTCDEARELADAANAKHPVWAKMNRVLAIVRLRAVIDAVVVETAS